MEAAWELFEGVPGGIVATAILGLAALALWRLRVGFVDEYRRLCTKACTLLTTHAPAITNLSAWDQLTPEQRAWRTTAQTELREVADRLTNEQFPPHWLTKALGLPAPDDAREAGRTIRGISNNLFADREARRAQEAANRDDRDEARRLLGCREERTGERPRISN